MILQDKLIPLTVYKEVTLDQCAQHILNDVGLDGWTVQIDKSVMVWWHCTCKVHNISAYQALERLAEHYASRIEINEPSKVVRFIHDPA